ncbi:MAG TPA: hypothetical protein ENJ08_00620 [Gammaproteobacteria bacterium]|nr:hypothetical protein [Gammaproteobacteria bacterium]
MKIKNIYNINQHGIEIIRNSISDNEITKIKNEVSLSCHEYSGCGIRNADKKFSSIDVLVNSDKMLRLASSILGSQAEIVRVIFFDKTPDKNWLVSWHQDRTIALDRKADISGWGPWSVKDGAHHVQPPIEVLNSMVTFRLHLDNADQNNGCLKVIPQSHKSGILSQAEIKNIVNMEETCMCEARQGDLLLMRPHLLHASSKALKPGHRRVVHVEYSNYILPVNLQWA